MLIKDRYYIIDISDIQKPTYLNSPFREKELARLAIEYYLKEGTFDIFRGTKVILMGLKPSPYRYPKFTPKALRKFKMRNIQLKRELLKGSGIVPHKFRVHWEPKPEEKRARYLESKKGLSVARTRILK